MYLIFNFFIKLWFHCIIVLIIEMILIEKLNFGRWNVASNRKQAKSCSRVLEFFVDDFCLKLIA